MTHHKMKIHPEPLADLLSGAKTGEVRREDDRKFQVGDTVTLVELNPEDSEPTGLEVDRIISHVQRGYGLPDGLCVLSYASAAPEQEPVAEVEHCNSATAHVSLLGMQKLKAGQKLYTHADPAEVERLRGENARLLSAGQALEADFSSYRREVEHKAETATQRADAAERKLGERDALLRRARRFVEDWDDDSQEFIDLCGEIDNVLASASAEPAECQHRYMYFGTQPARRCADCNKVEPAKGGDGEADHA